MKLTTAAKRLAVGIVTVLVAVGIAYAAENVEIMGSTGTSAVKVRVDSNGRLEIGGGEVADDAASGTPSVVPVGGEYNATKPTYTDGDRALLQTGSRGGLNVNIFGADNSQGAAVFATNAAGQAYSAGLSAVSFPNDYNGATYDPKFTCPSSAVVNVAAAATTQLVALSGSTIIRVCSFVITGDTAATTATFVYGTGANCATGQVALTGAMRMVDEGNLSATGMNGSLFRGAAANALCLTAATGAVSGFVTYAQF